MMKVSIVIPTYNRADSMERLLTALNSQTFPHSDFEVVVSIDGSEDGTREMIKKFPAAYTIRSIWHPNSGRVKACNRGIEAASGEILIILDDDMEPSPPIRRSTLSISFFRGEAGRNRRGPNIPRRFLDVRDQVYSIRIQLTAEKYGQPEL